MNKFQNVTECPFTWDIPSNTLYLFVGFDEPDLEVDENPLSALIRSVMYTYNSYVRGDVQKALENLKLTDEIWDQSKLQCPIVLNEEWISKRVLRHLVDATKYHVYKEESLTREAQEIWEKLEFSSDFTSDIEKATLNGCRGTAWATFYEYTDKEAFPFLSEAVRLSPQCPLWQLMYAKNLRYKRRSRNNQQYPSAEEKNAFLKLNELSDDPYYQIHVAEMYHESWDRELSKKVFTNILASDPKSYRILLRLAKAFSNYGEKNQAEACFKKIDEIGWTKTSMYHHYKAIYFQKQRNFKEALICLENAIKDNNNYNAEKQYVFLMHNTGQYTNLDIIGYLKKMLEKYEYNSCYKQEILLNIAMHSEESRRYEALPYFLEAIKVNPKHPQLKKFFQINRKRKNTDVFLHVRRLLIKAPNSPVTRELKNIIEEAAKDDSMLNEK